MNEFEKSTIEKNQNYLVTKSNDLIMKTKIGYDANVQKMAAFICSKIITTEGGYKLDFEFNIADYLRITNTQKSGNSYKIVKNAIKTLRDKSFWIKNDKNVYKLISWIDDVVIYENSGTVYYSINNEIVPYLFDLKNKFFSYELINILKFKSKYSILIYEFLKSSFDLMCSVKKIKDKFNVAIPISISVEKLRENLMIDDNKYKNFKDFRKNVLEKSQSEINEFSNIEFEFKPITYFKKIAAIEFEIKYKK